MQINLYNSLVNSIQLFSPLKDNTVRMYSCGPTVYNYAHIGNMRAFLFADFLQRVLRTVGQYNMQWVMNITNIDDKTIRDSQLGSDKWLAEMGEQTESPLENLAKLTEFYENSFVEDISKLGIKREHFFAMPRATDYIDSMQKLIINIINMGYAYIAGGSVYFDVNKWRNDDVYGKLFKVDFENFKPGTRIDSDQYEREQANDFVLWKSYREGEPAWDFVIDGTNFKGRPGWHVECSAMEFDLLGIPFDIHTGGVDLKFPHHEDEIAQSKAGYGIEPTAFWCHNEFLEVEGEKMSKSLSNFFSLRDLIEKGLDPLDIRFAMLSAHYSSKYNFTFDGVASAKKARNRVQEFIYSIWDIAEGHSEINTSELSDNLKNAVFTQLAHDLHAPKALAELFAFMNANNPNSIDKNDAANLIEFFKLLNNIFDVWAISKRKEQAIPDDIIELANQRFNAQKSKDFAKADELRNIISSKGYTIKDTKDGFELIKN